MNVFSSDAALNALAAALGVPGAPKVAATVDGMTFRTLEVDGRPLAHHRLVDFLEPVDHDAPVEGDERSLRLPLRYLPRVARHTVAATAWPEVASPELDPAPFVRWDRFADWDDFERAVTTRRKKLWADSRRTTARLHETAGPLTFVDDDGDDEAWTTCVRWKRAQYARTGAPDGLGDPESQAFLAALRTAGVARMATLRAGGRLVAAHIGLWADGRQYYWLPAYDPEFEKHSPGRLLLHHLLRASAARGDAEFDFLFGDEEYKWWYATDVRVISSIGQPGPIDRIRRYRHVLPRRHPELRRRAQVVVRGARRLRARGDRPMSSTGAPR